MLKLTRMERIHEQAQLPNGTVIEVNCNVQLMLPDLLRFFGEASAISEEMKRTKDYTRKGEFYIAYAKLIRAVMGAEAYTQIYNAFDGDIGELSETLSPWIMETVIPAMTRASKSVFEAEKRRRK